MYMGFDGDVLQTWIGEQMNSKLDEYNRGIFKYKTETLNISKEEIIETISCGEEYESSIELTTDSNMYVKGIVYSSHEFVKIIDKISNI